MFTTNTLSTHIYIENCKKKHDVYSSPSTALLEILSCVPELYEFRTESVDSLCRDGADTPIVRVYTLKSLANARACTRMAYSIASLPNDTP